MNNYYTLLCLVAELRYEILNKEVIEVWSSRKDQIDFFLSAHRPVKITFSAASPATALFLDRRAAVPSRNAAKFFTDLAGLRIADVEMPSPADRYIRILFKDSDLELLFKPFSSRPNVFLIRDGIIIESFKDDSGCRGRPAPDMAFPDSTVDNTIFSDSGETLPLKKKIVAIDKRFPRGLIDDIAVTCSLESAEVPEIKEKLDELKDLLVHPSTISITAEGKLSLLPPKYLLRPPEKTFRTVNDAIRTLFLKQNREKSLVPQKRDIERKIVKRISGLHKQLEQFDKQKEQLQKADKLEHYGHLLISQPHSDKPAVDDKIPVTDWADDGREQVIPIARGETLIQQARKYYDKATRIRKEIAISGEKKSQIEKQKGEMEKLYTELSEIYHPGDLQKWLAKNEDKLSQAGLKASTGQPVARPYRLIQINDYEIWIGKSAKSNDEILSLSHKEDIWLHARGTAGSHVIIRNKGRLVWPDRKIILKAASCAAAYSRQSGSSLVPVITAKRKHVRKPKGAQPGQVIVTKERVELVAPEKP